MNKLNFLLTIQDNISLTDNKLDLTKSNATIISLIVFPIVAIIIYLILKKKYNM